MFMKTITLATFATGAMARSLKQEDRGMLLAVQKPTIEASSTDGEVVVSWKTGPSATTESYTVSCFSGDSLTCDTYPDALGGVTASGELEKALLPSTVSKTLTLAGAAGDSVQCFIEVEGQFGFATKCVDLETEYKATARSVEDDPERLLATVLKPTVETDISDITVSWKTGPVFVDASYIVSCYEVLDGADPITCKNLEDNEPIAVAEGDYDKTLLKDEYTEVLEYWGVNDQVVQCFIEVEGEYGHEKCKEAGEATFDVPDARIAGSIIKPKTVATGAGLGEVSFETIGAVEYEYSIQCYDKDALDLAGEFLTCLPLGGKLDFGEAGDFLIEETDGTTEVGKSTTTWAFGDALEADKTAQCFIFAEGPYGKLDKCMSAGEAVLEDQAARLFATVQKPTVEADFVDGDITVSWKTGPALVDGSYTVSCYEVLLGADPITCKNLEDNLPVAVAEGDYDKTLLKDEYTEVLSYDGADGEIVQCFIEVEGEFGHEKCKEAGEATFEAPAPAP